jgi:hypothetical protein
LGNVTISYALNALRSAKMPDCKSGETSRLGERWGDLSARRVHARVERREVAAEPAAAAGGLAEAEAEHGLAEAEAEHGASCSATPTRTRRRLAQQMRTRSRSNASCCMSTQHSTLRSAHRGAGEPLLDSGKLNLCCLRFCPGHGRVTFAASLAIYPAFCSMPRVAHPSGGAVNRRVSCRSRRRHLMQSGDSSGGTSHRAGGRTGCR